MTLDKQHDIEHVTPARTLLAMLGHMGTVYRYANSGMSNIPYWGIGSQVCI